MKPARAALPRRAFLGQLGGALGATALAACRQTPPDNASADAASTDADSTDADSTDANSTDAGQAAADLPVGPSEVSDAGVAISSAALADLRKSIQGKVFVPSDQGYDEARLLYNSRFDHLKPQVVVACLNAQDAKQGLAWARNHAMPLAIRGGGHSYAGWSSGTGLALDLRSLAAIEFLADNKVRVGAGCLLMDLYAALAAKGLLIPGGSGPTVGIAGLALGGGYGLSSRQFGLTCDSLVELEMVSASGDLLTCNAKTNADLLWASQGGGGGSFGIVTSLTFQAQPIPQDLCWFAIEWPWQDAAAVVQAWQGWAPQAPPEVTSLLHLFAGKDHGEAPTISVVGQVFGTVAKANSLIQPMLSVGKPGPPALGTKDFLAMSLLWADCSVLANCHPKPKGDLPRGNYLAKSDYATQPLPMTAIAAMVQAMEVRQKSAPFGAILLDAYGGAIGKKAAGETAFVHRDVLFSAQYLAMGKAGAPADVDQQNHAWLQSLYAQLRPHFSGQVYQNYIDAELKDWQTAYYGANYAKLQKVKASYDPQNVFRFPQSIEVG